MHIVLVHGIYNTGRRFRVMQAAFEAAGYPCLAPSLSPNSGRNGLEPLAEQVKTAVDSIGAGEAIGLLGFSMGGLIARHYLQILGGCQAVKLFVAIATPHHGSYWAHCLPTQGGRQMRPGSGFLRALQENSACLEGLPCYSYWTPFDLVVVPPASAVWEQAENIRVDVPAHYSMVKDARVIGSILQKLAAAG